MYMYVEIVCLYDNNIVAQGDDFVRVAAVGSFGLYTPHNIYIYNVLAGGDKWVLERYL